MTTNISEKRLREIIVEEMNSITEGVDHTAIKDVVGRASDLLAAIADFKEEAPGSMLNAVTPNLSQLEEMLEKMVSNPGSYVVVPKQKKVVSLRSTPSAQ